MQPQGAHPKNLARVDRLVGESAWVRRLAHALVADPHAAEDVFQDAWVAALRRGPPLHVPLGRWLTAVVRNLARDRWRSQRRREAREALVARQERGEPPADALERLEVQDRVAAAVRALDEPYRSVIVLRYLDELSPPQIAERLGVPVRTVNTRISRALSLLRLRLQHDSQQGSLALLPWLAALARPLKPGVGGVLLLKPHSKLALCVAVIALLGIGILFLVRGTAGAGASSSELLTVTRDAESSKSAGTARAEPDARVHLHAADPAIESASAAAARDVFRGLVIDANDRPVPGVRIVLREQAGAGPLSDVAIQSEADGRFAFPDSGRDGFLACADDAYTALLRPAVQAGNTRDELVMVVVPRAALRGRVTDESGNSIEGAYVELKMPRDLRSRIRRPLYASEDARWMARTEAQGRFAFEDAPALPGRTIQAQAPGFERHFERQDEGVASFVHIVLGPPSGLDPTLHGMVVDPRGAPVGDAVVGLGDECARSNARGEFALAVRWFREPPGPDEIVFLRAVKAGHLPAELKGIGRTCAVPEGWPQPLVLQLGEAPLRIEGRVIDEERRPVARVAVRLFDPTGLGRIGNEEQGRILYRHTDIEMIAGGRASPADVVTDARGAFAIPGLLPRAYRLHVFDPSTLAFVLTEPISAGSLDVQILLTDPDRLARVRGRVVDPAGSAVPDAEVRLHRSTPILEDDGTIAGYGTSEGLAVRTDPSGRFEFTGVSARIGMISAVPPDDRWVPDYTFAFDPGQDVVIRVGHTCHMWLDLTGSDVSVDQMFTIDDARTLKPMRSSAGPSSPWSSGMQLLSERSEVVAVSSLATQLELLRYGEIVTTLPLKLKVGELNVIRP